MKDNIGGEKREEGVRVKNVRKGEGGRKERLRGRKRNGREQVKTRRDQWIEGGSEGMIENRRGNWKR